MLRLAGPPLLPYALCEKALGVCMLFVVTQALMRMPRFRCV